MKRGLSPGILIGIVFVVAGALFGVLIAVALNQKPSSPKSAPGAAQAGPSGTSTPPPTVVIGTLTKSPARTQVELDTLNDGPFPAPQAPPTRIPAASPVTVRGWAIDAPNNTLAGGVIVSVDDTLSVRADYGQDRQDVADFLKNPAVRKCGFVVRFPPGMIPSGTHTLTIKVLTNDGSAYYQAPQVIQIEIA